MAPQFHYEIYLTLVGNKRVIRTRKTVGDMQVHSDGVELPTGPVRLKIESDTENYKFYFAPADGEWKLLGSGLVKLLESEVADVWSGSMFGMYATGNGHPIQTPADFDWFEYHPAPINYRPEY